MHLHGAVCALVGCAILGARIGRFKTPSQPAVPLLGHSVPVRALPGLARLRGIPNPQFQFAALGGFILMFGFFAFNGGSQASISAPGDGPIVAKAMINTIINAAFSTLTVLFFRRMSGHWSFLRAVNATLTGPVCIIIVTCFLVVVRVWFAQGW